LEVVEVMIIPWDDMIYIGCSQGATLVSELTSMFIPIKDDPSKGRPIWW
jgi:hypothetical protein